MDSHRTGQRRICRPERPLRKAVSYITEAGTLNETLRLTEIINQNNGYPYHRIRSVHRPLFRP